MTFDPEQLDNFWNADYFPEVIDVEKASILLLTLLKTALADIVKLFLSQFH